MNLTAEFLACGAPQTLGSDYTLPVVFIDSPVISFACIIFLIGLRVLTANVENEDRPEWEAAQNVRQAQEAAARQARYNAEWRGRQAAWLVKLEQMGCTEFPIHGLRFIVGSTPGSVLTRILR